MTLSATHPKGHEQRVPYETINNCIYAKPVGEFKLDLIKALRQAHNKGVPRSIGQDRRRQIPDMLSIHVRSQEIEGRRHHQGRGQCQPRGRVDRADQPIADVDQAAAGQTSQCAQCVAGLHGQTFEYCFAAAHEHDL